MTLAAIHETPDQWLAAHRGLPTNDPEHLITDGLCRCVMRASICRAHQTRHLHENAEGILRPEFTYCKDCRHFKRKSNPPVKTSLIRKGMTPEGVLHEIHRQPPMGAGLARLMDRLTNPDYFLKRVREKSETQATQPEPKPKPKPKPQPIFKPEPTPELNNDPMLIPRMREKLQALMDQYPVDYKKSCVRHLYPIAKVIGRSPYTLRDFLGNYYKGNNQRMARDLEGYFKDSM